MQSLIKQWGMAVILAMSVCTFASAYAQDTQTTPSAQVQKVLAPVESLVNKNTFVLAYIDVKALDLDQSVANWKQLVTDLFAKVKADKLLASNLESENNIDLDTMQSAYFKWIDEGLREIKPRFDAIQAAGLKDVYVLANSR
ncbi:MAG: hypothetical protein FWD31_08680, partial [Planctomycetaceae bacterium]|nr:hypothetical protein [Planctomycetaceae bacterium]